MRFSLILSGFVFSMSVLILGPVPVENAATAYRAGNTKKQHRELTEKRILPPQRHPEKITIYYNELKISSVAYDTREGMVLSAFFITTFFTSTPFN
ncbi:hypothetical protein ACFFJN_01565 [Erwinia mallotivora]|uniref:hypothetical protein n=1 Tax=Erwinia mallotivora TaxID=69222 RepID=UPI0035ED3096